MKHRYAIMVGIGLVFCAAVQVFAEDNPVQGQANCKVSSAFVWRGKEINDDAVIQPELILGKDPFSLDIWGTWDWTGEKESSQRTRVDTSVDYSFSWKQLFFKAGMVAYAYHDGPPDVSMKDTFEVYFETMADVLLDPSLIVYYDFEAIEGTYAALSIGENVAVGKGMDLQMRIRLGVGTSAFNKGFFRLEAIKAGKEDEFSPDGGAVDMSSAIKVVIPVQERVTIVPCFEYTSLLDSDLRDIVKEAGKKADNAIGSLMISWSF